MTSLALLHLKSGETVSCIVRGETTKKLTIQVMRVYNSLFDYTSGIPKTINKNKINKVEWKS